jgi:hypothetical protein
MQLDYLLLEKQTGFIAIANEDDSEVIQNFLFAHGYSWVSGEVQHLGKPFLFVHYTSKYLTYGSQTNYAGNRYKDITKEIYELAGLTASTYEYW